jgi:hypothetical protein
VTETVLAPASTVAEARRCRWCHLPIRRCPVLAEGYVTYCGGWVHIPLGGQQYGRHSCGATGTSTQATPEKRGNS